MESETAKWYALRTMYRNDMNVARHFESLGAEVFLPMHYVDVVRGNAIRRVLEPVVRNIVFVRCARQLIDHQKELLESRWAIRLFMDVATHEAIVIPEEQMRRFIAVAGTYDEQLLYLGAGEVALKEGDMVRVVGGPFVGAEGRLLRVRGHKRVVEEIEGVMAVATAYIPMQMVEKIYKYS